MTNPISIEIPHSLGREAARNRLDKGLGQFAQMVPGGSLNSHHWDGDTLHFEVEAMGQRVSAELDVRDTVVNALVDLPPLAAMFAEKIKTKLGQVGIKLLT